MKKLKPFIIILVIVALAVGGLFAGYKYSQGKKTAQVVSLANYGMDGYWGDTIESYGDVTADKSQSVYIATGTEIKSVNVAEGDHVNAGDVIMTVNKGTQDINGKTLQLQKATQNLEAEQKKLERLEKTKPIPEYIHTQEVYREKTFVAEKEYIAVTDVNIGDFHYLTDDIIAIESFDTDGEILYTSYLKPGYTENGGRYEELEEDSDIDPIKSYLANKDNEENFKKVEIEETFDFLASTLYLDGETKQIVGEDSYEGEGVHTGMPEGLKPSELAEEIKNQTIVVERQDLECRKLENELEVMKNTTDDGAIIAKVSGTVSKIQNKDNYNNTQPFVVVAATDEYYITGSIGEFYLDSVNVGDTVSVMSWDNGVSTEAVIASISENPSTGNNFYSGGGNSNSSNYEFKATFDRSCGIEIGSAVDISITPAGQESSGYYIPSHFIRKDASGSFVMKMNSKGKLKKEYVKVGKVLWGSMTEVKQGVAPEEYLAFPYGNGEIEGISCEVVDELDY
ncbi:biotin/lipoyl-binding protein [Pseudobutyrivibrio sp. MD2005]|uniref:biotin/lipoyl-binding protein n=1 Tax=Pseudobutyrivibrio sp. MD2005 TaxID=1410616 RepID=UPI000482191A|nr:biotin/lipoyl-binding protein [Pseudobutyrivibrio sp. MD2005]